MDYRIELEQEVNGRWIADVADLWVVLAYGSARERNLSHAQHLALRALAERREHGDAAPDSPA